MPRVPLPGAMTVQVLHPWFQLRPLLKEAKRRTRRRRVRLAIALLVVSVLATGLAVAFRSTGAPVAVPATTIPIRVTLTAENHRPRASRSPGWQWWYSVKVLTAAGKPVPAHIRLQILSGHAPVEAVALITLDKGSPDWRGAIGGEANVLAAAPRGRKLFFEAVVTAEGVTIRRFWPIVVR